MKEYNWLKLQPGEKISIRFLPLPTVPLPPKTDGHLVQCCQPCPICEMLEDQRLRRIKEGLTDGNA